MHLLDLLNHLDNVFTAEEPQFLQAILLEQHPIMPVAIETPIMKRSKHARTCRIKDCDALAGGYGYCSNHTKMCVVRKAPNQKASASDRHGGGQRCNVPDCIESVQRNGRCTFHGGRSDSCTRAQPNAVVDTSPSFYTYTCTKRERLMVECPTLSVIA